MRRSSLVTGALLLGLPLAPLAGQERWNDRVSDAWLRDAPRVRVWIDGNRSVHVGSHVRVQFDVSDEAYVVVGRVSSDGRLTILHPRNRNQRPLAGAGVTHTVFDPRTGAPGGFVVNERFGGYVFALASYAPLDLTVLETRDFQRTMGYSNFSLANRAFARSPDEYIPRFAALLLWGDDVSYDYDVDYYHPYETSRYASALAFCNSGYNRAWLFGGGYGVGASRLLHYGYGFDDWDFGGYYSTCGDYFHSLRCVTYAAFYGFGCPALRSRNQYASGPVIVEPGSRTDSAATPNGSIILGGLWRPDTVGLVPEGPTGERDPSVDPGATGKRLSQWDGVYSIPARAVTRLKQRETQDDATAGAINDLSRFRSARADADAPRRTKGGASDYGDRVEPVRPTRERTAAPSRTRERSSGASSSPGRSRPSYGNTTSGRQRATKPASATPPRQTTPSITKSKPASSGDKTKPPQ